MVEDRFKLRVWNKDKNEMLFPHNPNSGDNRYIHIRDNFILMQCTGRTDENKKSIYEGDIIENTYTITDRTYKEILLVGYSTYFASFTFRGKGYCNTTIGLKTFGEVNWTSFSFEIIGNKYQNPKLMEKLK